MTWLGGTTGEVALAVSLISAAVGCVVRHNGASGRMGDRVQRQGGLSPTNGVALDERGTEGSGGVSI